ncbi:MAG TPA: hypothetical protein VGX25_04885 [Actinophytocola sp.]|uniref:hypothetical protein n=1 Tax=Actinophytocola sp. TaxID=1872138 RepID=UPI002DDCE51A|nr:hypothetical protein [Actinophytocola sp.]HEV2778717.1 hypothetical protein [Actinophytocola sp.]
MFRVLAISYHRRHGTGWTWAAIGILAAPTLLAVVLVVIPSILAHLDLLPS